MGDNRQQFCVSRVTKQKFTFSRFSKIEVVQNVKNGKRYVKSHFVKQSASIIFWQVKYSFTNLMKNAKRLYIP